MRCEVIAFKNAKALKIAVVKTVEENPQVGEIPVSPTAGFKIGDFGNLKCYVKSRDGRMGAVLRLEAERK